MKFLKLIIKYEHDDSLKPPTIIVDNAKTHTSNLTKEIVSKLIFKARFLVPYCPEIAPVEQAFGIIKSKLRSNGIPKTINFDKDEGIQLILNLVASISHASWEKMWINVIQEAKATLVKMKEDSNRPIQFDYADSRQVI